MSIYIEDYKFDDLSGNIADLKNQSGVYVIAGWNSSKTDWDFVDIGESENVKNRIETHDREDCWYRQNFKNFGVTVHYCDEADRMDIEKKLRKKHNPPCGER